MVELEKFDSSRQISELFMHGICTVTKFRGWGFLVPEKSLCFRLMHQLLFLVSKAMYLF